ncbi:MAG: DUF2079 domain-containing protein [Archangium sp.]
MTDETSQPVVPVEVVTSEAPPQVPVEQPAPVFPEFVEALGWLGAAGASLGMFVGTLANYSAMPDWVLRNRLPPPARNALLICMGVGLLLFIVPAIAVLLKTRLAKLENVRRLALRLSPLTVLGPLPAMLNDRAWTGQELVFTTLTAALSMLAYLTLTQSMAQGPMKVPAVFERLARSSRAPVIVAATASVFYAVWFSVFSISAHYQLVTSSFDLGVENNLLWHASHFGPLFRTTPLGGSMTHLGFHQTYFSYLLAIPYRVWPDAKFLLIFQSCVLGGAGFVLFVLARQKLGAWAAAALTWAYALYSPLHGANLYDFHYTPLSVIFLFGLVLCAERGWWKRAALCVVLTLSLREDMGLLLAVVCAWLALRNLRPGLMLAFIAASFTHFVVLKMVIMPRFLGGAASYIHQYAAMLGEGDTGFGGVIKTLLSNPGYTMTWLMEPGKQQYVMLVLGPLVFLPLMRRGNLVLLLPGFFFTLLSTRYPALMMISFQYSAYWIPFVFLAAVTTLAWLAEKHVAAMRVAVLTMLLATVLHARQFGAVLHIENVHVHFSSTYHLVPTPAEHARWADFKVVAAMIPDDAKVAATELLVPHFSSRDFIYTLRNGFLDAEWIIVTQPRNDEVGQVRAALDGEYGVVEVRNDFLLLRRGFPKSRNAEGNRFAGR